MTEEEGEKHLLPPDASSAPAITCVFARMSIDLYYVIKIKSTEIFLKDFPSLDTSIICRVGLWESILPKRRHF
jgi:hypothetical protein